MDPTEVVGRYVALFNGGRHDELGHLFAEDAVWRPAPPGPEVSGGAGIRAGYEEHHRNLQTVDMQAVIRRCLVDGNSVAAELNFSTATHSVDVVNVFDIDAAGKITRMTAYPRPPVTLTSS